MITARTFAIACLGVLASMVLAMTGVSGAAQQTASEAVPPRDEATPLLRTRTRLVVLDVAVRDAQNRPVHGIPRSAFRVAEDHAPQAIRNFEPHTAQDVPQTGPPAPALPPGSFTNYAPVPQNGTLNVLLVDALNTSANDQTYLREQMRQFVEHAPAGQSIAIFGLTSRLTLLQGFTQDPAQLRDALSHRTPRNGSSLLDDSAGTRNDAPRASDAFADLGVGTEDAVASLQQFESDTEALQQNLRAQFTLDALTALGKYLSSFSGRKNVIWFSGAFPINLLPDPSVANGFRGMQGNAEQLRRTSELLAQARVSVFPVDTRGLQTQPLFDAANSGKRYAGAPARVGTDLATFSASQNAEHTAMLQIAGDTGGHAYFNTNGLADAVGKALEEGQDYYTLTYTPTNTHDDETPRQVHVELGAAYANAGLTLNYRHSYFALPPSAEVQGATATRAGNGDGFGANVTPYARMALGFGAPPPQDILFQARVEIVPATSTDAALPAHAPAHVYMVHFGALTQGITFAPSAGNRRTAHVTFQVLVYSPQGELRNRVGKELHLNLNRAEFAAVQNAGVGISLSVNAAPDSFLRMVVQDVPSDRYGALQISATQAQANR